MGNEVVASLVQNKIPSGFWKLPEFASAEGFADVHTVLVERLQLEAPDADTLELMMMERVAFIYIYMRAIEFGESFKADQNYHRLLMAFMTAASDLRKTRLRAEETASIRMAIVSEVSRALKEAMKDLDPNLANETMGRLMSLVSVA